MIKLTDILTEIIKRDKYYYVQHLLDLDPNIESKKLLDSLEQNVVKWVKMYDPQLNGNQFDWHPTSTLSMGEYVIELAPNIYREGQIFKVFSIEIYLKKIVLVGKGKPKLIKSFEEPLDIESPDGRNWDFSALESKLANIIRSVKELIRKDYD